jgi:hypothetical protein
MRLLLWYLLLAYCVAGCSVALHLDPQQLDLFMEREEDGTMHERNDVPGKQPLPGFEEGQTSQHTGGPLRIPSEDRSTRLGGGGIVEPHVVGVSPLAILCRGGPGTHLAFPCGRILKVRRDGRVVGYGAAPDQPGTMAQSCSDPRQLAADVASLRQSLHQAWRDLYAAQTALSELRKRTDKSESRMRDLRGDVAILQKCEGIRLADNRVDEATTADDDGASSGGGVRGEVHLEADGTTTQLFPGGIPGA